MELNKHPKENLFIKLKRGREKSTFFTRTVRKSFLLSWTRQHRHIIDFWIRMINTLRRTGTNSEFIDRWRTFFFVFFILPWLLLWFNRNFSFWWRFFHLLIFLWKKKEVSLSNENLFLFYFCFEILIRWAESFSDKRKHLSIKTIFFSFDVKKRTFRWLIIVKINDVLRHFSFSSLFFFLGDPTAGEE